MNPPKKAGGALGKGLDALIKKEDVKAPIMKKTADVKKKSSKKSPKASSGKLPPKISVDDQAIHDVLLEVHKNPRISLWSARSAAVLRFLKKTKPEFSISKEASALIEAAVEDKYPDIWKLFQDQDI
ncbi:MAG TPA: AAA family ATPase [Methanobacteriaceae archaeon]|nr:AAA family ATPase [Methanobacteriaceae archaeon]